MAKKKFNLKTYLKTNGDEHVEQRLQEDHEDAPEAVVEEQLEGYRAPENEESIEKLLEKNRTGGAEQIIERQLDTATGGFVKQRNPEAYEGNMNKLEEQRLSGDTQEDEKYEAASEVAPKFRWWETKTGDDDLKLANASDASIRTAQENEEMTFDSNQEWGALNDNWSDDDPNEVDFDIEEIDPEVKGVNKALSPMHVTKKKYLSGVMPGVYMVLDYKIGDFNENQEAIISAAMAEAVNEDSRLQGLIGPSDFHIEDSEGGIGSVVLRSLGDEFASLVDGDPSVNVDEASDSDPIDSFQEESHVVSDMGGTPMATGSIKVSESLGDDNDPALMASQAVKFISSKHPDIQISEESLDLSQAESSGIISYIGQVGNTEQIGNTLASSDFTVTVASDIKKKTVG